MSKINKKDLSFLYHASDISDIWLAGQNLQIIDHPKFGKISPNYYRAKYNNRPCPFCGKMMVHGQFLHSTSSKKEAVSRGYQYKDKNGKDQINKVGMTYFHPHYVTLDHKLNKARCPENLFDYDNLQIMCWKCNWDKGDNNAFELQHSFEYLNDLANETLNHYPLL
jgi:hypothetical protein